MRVVTMTNVCEAYFADGVGGTKCWNARRLVFEELALGAVMRGGSDQRSGAGRLRAVSRWLEEF
jgi:hypothetical protein